MIPEIIGGFLWARTQCARCNSAVGARVEAPLKTDDSIRYALEVALAERVPDLAREFAKGQGYVGRSEVGNLHARMRNGSVALGTTHVSGSMIQPKPRARTTIDAILQRKGYSNQERRVALERLDAAPAGQITPISDDLSIRHGTVDGFALPLDGTPVSDHLPLAIAFQFLALCLGDPVYNSVFDPIRVAILEQRDGPGEFRVEALLDRRTGYQPLHVLGLSAAHPHLVIHVQLFGLLVWRVHFVRAGVHKLKPTGVALDLEERTAMPAEPEAVHESWHHG